MTTPKERSLGVIAYEAYGDSVDWKTFDGRPMPEWSDLGERIQQAWVDAALAVADSVDYSE